MPKKRKQKLRFRGLRFTEAKFRAHAAAIGQVLLLWNDLHEQLAVIFWTLNSYNDSVIPKWNAAHLDRKKRDLIREWIRAVPPQHRVLFP
jgi:hypothetical protein